MVKRGFDPKITVDVAEEPKKTKYGCVAAARGSGRAADVPQKPPEKSVEDCVVASPRVAEEEERGAAGAADLSPEEGEEVRQIMDQVRQDMEHNPQDWE